MINDEELFLMTTWLHNSFFLCIWSLQGGHHQTWRRLCTHLPSPPRTLVQCPGIPRRGQGATVRFSMAGLLPFEEWGKQSEREGKAHSRQVSARWVLGKICTEAESRSHVLTPMWAVFSLKAFFFFWVEEFGSRCSGISSRHLAFLY